ncbi:hypothetical protein PR048_017438 [Dryococelus australis]|uniref:Uncharacterized protein n=1 Tax=Dryococelus australis TaxID=614101 RepID=A0ABQ9H9I7_9NEOP|nr:hypothetical protein PR048_017438 [Dryococelus australis]
MKAVSHPECLGNMILLWFYISLRRVSPASHLIRAGAGNRAHIPWASDNNDAGLVSSIAIFSGGVGARLPRHEAHMRLAHGVERIQLGEGGEERESRRGRMREAQASRDDQPFTTAAVKLNLSADIPSAYISISKPYDAISTSAGMKERGKRDIEMPTSGIVRHDSHLRKSGVNRPGIDPASPWWEASSPTAQPPRSPSAICGDVVECTLVPDGRGLARRAPIYCISAGGIGEQGRSPDTCALANRVVPHTYVKLRHDISEHLSRYALGSGYLYPPLMSSTSVWRASFTLSYKTYALVTRTNIRLGRSYVLQSSTTFRLYQQPNRVVSLHQQFWVHKLPAATVLGSRRPLHNRDGCVCSFRDVRHVKAGTDEGKQFWKTGGRVDKQWELGRLGSARLGSGVTLPGALFCNFSCFRNIFTLTTAETTVAGCSSQTEHLCIPPLYTWNYLAGAAANFTDCIVATQPACPCYNTRRNHVACEGPSRRHFISIMPESLSPDEYSTTRPTKIATTTIFNLANRSAAEKRSRSKLLMKTVHFERETTAIGTCSELRAKHSIVLRTWKPGRAGVTKDKAIIAATLSELTFLIPGIHLACVFAVSAAAELLSVACTLRLQSKTIVHISTADWLLAVTVGDYDWACRRLAVVGMEKAAVKYETAARVSCVNYVMWVGGALPAGSAVFAQLVLDAACYVTSAPARPPLPGSCPLPASAAGTPPACLSVWCRLFTLK